MSDDTLVRLVQEIEDAQDQALQITPPIARTGGLSMSSAYTVAAHIHASRCAKGDVSVGRKIGFTNAALWDVYGVREPIWGHMYERTVTFAQGPSMQCSLAGLCEPKIEPEIVLHFSRAPGPSADAAEIAQCIDWIAHGFEIVQSNYAGWRFQAAHTVADSSLHDHLCVGELMTPGTLTAAYSVLPDERWHTEEAGNGMSVDLPGLFVSFVN